MQELRKSILSQLGAESVVAALDYIGRTPTTELWSLSYSR